MPFPPSKNRANRTDPNADAVARERNTLKEHVAGSTQAANLKDKTYTDHESLVSAEVASQTARDRAG